MSDTELHELDQLIDTVSQPVNSQCELLREHLQSARTYLLGQMTEEYVFTLRLADQVVNCMAQEEQRRRASEAIHHLIGSVR